MTAPLDGLVVVALEQAISAPFASRQLADLGATVIKVERPEGDFARNYDSIVKGNSAFFVWANRGKQSITIDMSDPEQMATLDALIAGADVFMHNVSPEAAARRGLSADALHARFPSLIACEISGYGEGGPRSADKAYDLAIQAEAGAFSVSGTEAEMSKVGFSIADIASATNALTAILAAVIRRDRTGEGASIKVSMLEALTEWMSAPLYAAVYGGGQAPRTGRRHHAIAPYGTFQLADGQTLLIAVQNDGEWKAMAEHVLGDPELGTDPRFATNGVRIVHVDELEPLLIAALTAVPADDAIARLRKARIAFSHVNDLQGVWNHEQLRARGRFHDVMTEHGPVEMLDPPFDISGMPLPLGPVPALNEHDDVVIQRVTRR
jgi:itaconate CoA-transferase